MDAEVVAEPDDGTAAEASGGGGVGGAAGGDGERVLERSERDCGLGF